MKYKLVIIFLFSALWSANALAADVKYHPQLVHGRAVLYHETVVEKVEYYFRRHKFQRGPALFFIRSCVWLKKYSAYDYCYVSSSGKITLKILVDNGMATQVKSYYSVK